MLLPRFLIISETQIITCFISAVYNDTTALICPSSTETTDDFFGGDNNSSVPVQNCRNGYSMPTVGGTDSGAGLAFALALAFVFALAFALGFAFALALGLDGDATGIQK